VEEPSHSRYRYPPIFCFDPYMRADSDTTVTQIDTPRLPVVLRAVDESSSEPFLLSRDRASSNALRDIWEGEVEEQCRRALSGVRERALAQAECCLQASRDLDEHGVDSWIARAFLRYLTS
jgi:hypothetical protein